MREVVIPLPEVQLVPFNEHPAAAGAGSFYVNAPSVDLRVLAVPLTAGVIVEIQRHVYAVVFFHHLAESDLSHLSDEIVAGDLLFGARFCRVLPELNGLL